MTKAQNETLLRQTYLALISNAINERQEIEPLRVSASEVAIPCLNADGEESWVLVKVSIPRGTRNGSGGYDPYDGYYLAELYAEDVKNRAAKKAEVEAKKQAKIAKDQKAREQKKALAEANKNLHELRQIKVTPKE